MPNLLLKSATWCHKRHNYFVNAVICCICIFVHTYPDCVYPNHDCDNPYSDCVHSYPYCVQPNHYCDQCSVYCIHYNTYCVQPNHYCIQFRVHWIFLFSSMFSFSNDRWRKSEAVIIPAYPTVIIDKFYFYIPGIFHWSLLLYLVL